MSFSFRAAKTHTTWLRLISEAIALERLSLVQGLDQVEDLHGPFRRELVSSSDFQLVSQAEFHNKVQAISAWI